jgi:hypothetical protein
MPGHKVRHEIGAVIAEYMWYVTNEGCPFHEARYLADLWKIVKIVTVTSENLAASTRPERLCTRLT